MPSDTIADMLTRIRNAMAVKKPDVLVPYSRIKHQIADILVQERYVLKAEKIGADKTDKLNTDLRHDHLRLVLKYRSNGTSYIRHIKRVSKPSRRYYVTADKMPTILRGLGTAIVSTSKGLLTVKQARQEKVGGELMLEIW